MRKWILPLGMSLALIVPAFGGVAAAAGPGNAGPGQSSSSHGNSGHSTGKPANPGAVGQTVRQAVYTALSSGAKGTALANAVHIVIGNLKPNAKGISVAEAVYQSVYQSVYGATGGTQTIKMNFTDMGGAGWAASSVNALFKAGVVRGTTNTTFSPNQKVTGAELLTMLDRLQNWQPPSGSSSGSSPLVTHAPAFALQAIQAALAQGVVQGVGGLSDPSAPLTRAQAITLLINSLGLNQLAQSLSGATLPLSGTVPSWSKGAISLAIQLGLVEGDNGQILANQTLTRAQMAVLLTRLATLEAMLAQSQSTT